MDDHLTVLHYVGADDDRSGIISVIRAMAGINFFDCLLGVNPGFVQHRFPLLRTLELSRVQGEVIGWSALWRARTVGREVRRWLDGGPRRMFHGHSRAGLLVALWLHRAGERRVIVTVHCYGLQRWFYRWAAAQLGERMIWLTPAMKAYYGVGKRTWDGCVPNSLPHTPSPPRHAALISSRLILGGAGQLVPWKGWHVVIESLALLTPSIRGRIEFRHIGTTNDTAESAAYARELVRLAEERGVEAQVKWLGWQSSSAQLLTEIDCLVVPSDHEPFSMVALEALFAGLPVLAADTGGPTDFVTEGQNGWFFRTGEARDLARVITMLLESSALAAIEIETTALRRFTTQEIAPQWARIYERTLATK
jgi:glycosyltransferase involved in cell wall biosynthesis